MSEHPPRSGFDRRLLPPMILGAVLNPVNSSILAVSLVPIGRDFHAPSSQTAWLVSALYLATAIGQPIAGALVDRLGPRRLFIAGSALTGLAGVIGPLAPSLTVLVLARVILGFGTCAGYPAAMYLIRSEAHRTGEDSPAGVLTALAVSTQTIAVIGPPLGGLLIGAGGWRLTLALNIPLAAACLVLGWRRLPVSAPMRSQPGAALPKLDLLGNRPLLRTYLRTLLSMVISYAFLYGFTQWLQEGRGLTAAQSGLVLLPLSLVGISVAAATGRREEVRGKLLVGSSAQVVGCGLLLVLGSSSPIWLLLLVLAIVGVPQGLNNLANQNALYHQADPARIGASAGLLRTFGYVGAIVAGGAAGAFFGDRASTGGLHELGALLVVLAALLLALTMADRGLGAVGGKSRDATAEPDPAVRAAPG